MAASVAFGSLVPSMLIIVAVVVVFSLAWGFAAAALIVEKCARRRRATEAFADARADARQSIERLGGQIFILGDTTEAKGALVDASERHAAALSQLESATTLKQLGFAKQSALEGLDYIAVARSTIGMNPSLSQPYPTAPCTELNSSRSASQARPSYWRPILVVPAATVVTAACALVLLAHSAGRTTTVQSASPTRMAPASSAAPAAVPTVSRPETPPFVAPSYEDRLLGTWRGRLMKDTGEDYGTDVVATITVQATGLRVALGYPHLGCTAAAEEISRQDDTFRFNWNERTGGSHCVPTGLMTLKLVGADLQYAFTYQSSNMEAYAHLVRQIG